MRDLQLAVSNVNLVVHAVAQRKSLFIVMLQAMVDCTCSEICVTFTRSTAHQLHSSTYSPAYMVQTLTLLDKCLVRQRAQLQAWYDVQMFVNSTGANGVLATWCAIYHLAAKQACNSRGQHVQSFCDRFKMSVSHEATFSCC